MKLVLSWNLITSEVHVFSFCLWGSNIWFFQVCTLCCIDSTCF